MTPSTPFHSTRTILLAAFSSIQALVAAQNCYYPNGDLSTTDAPCSSAEGAACCPLDWQCLDNGLCYLDNQKYFGRYTCTDKSWQSSACPGFCTNNKSDFGAQAVQQCSNHGNQYCCDQNRDVNNVCCNRNDDSLFFPLPQGTPTATIARLGAPAAAASGDSKDSNKNETDENETDENEPDENETDESNAPAASTSPTTPESPAASERVASTTNNPPTPQNNIKSQSPTTTSSTPTTITSSSTASSNGLTSLVLLTSIITTAPSPAAQITSPASPSASPSSSTNAAAIGGGVGGGIAALLLLSCLAFVLLRRRKRRRQREHEAATVQPPTTFLADQKVEDLEYMYKGQGTPGTTTTTATGGDGEQELSPELDGREIVPPVAATTGGYAREGTRGGRRPGEATRAEGLGFAGAGQRDKWAAYEKAAAHELAADGR
ncbi:MAG: hypothetical protein LQ344_004462 [Seirophora lacunosa]|nr:MAG: hypothetical protein LQ344_004462 [Seirophora lacunosa]